MIEFNVYSLRDGRAQKYVFLYLFMQQNMQYPVILDYLQGYEMTPCNSKSGKVSGVIVFEAGRDFIIVVFRKTKRYKYTYSSADRSTVEYMKLLALFQEGLSTFIAQHRPAYEQG